ncbi:EpsD family peptidyl-prolyl cis-trans isomerase [Dechloromonas sp. XY25]|uniref:EpsD family peptidyl-prolyl cis-trans isomerase n=1 Tax=Dechloromonas hankyongensis TaxID=2908002 RepID=A0ABS9K642_9RHOO|nr:EpsD family peptidyl-prolyl cis-trans isomerase [Dechloromonas hankyongensis]MCG2578628.1 EpsD family peptidyl-prolyl cis-trans isomerase [Dechloromonas hankyongensis]
MNPQLRALWVPLAVAMVVLAGCGKDIDAAAGGQVAATVNGKAIIFHQTIDAPHASDSGQPPAPPSQEAVDTLDRLIDQELLAQRAQEMNLDKDPTVMVELEAVRHHILAQAYVNRGMRVVEPSSEEVNRFYQDHPGLFEQRRIYYFQELITHVGHEHLEAFRQLVAISGKLDDIANWLSENDLPFQRVISIKTAEQLPTGLLPRLAMMQNAQMTIFEGSDSLNIVQLMTSQPAPFSLSEATPAIEKMLLAEKRQAFMREKASQLREKADIRYLGPFARETGATPPGASAAPTAPQPPAKDVTHINKGLSRVL